MFYRRKYYLVKPEIVESFNEHFNQTNLPEQLRNGSRLIGRWMKEREDGVEIFAIWEYDSYEDYVKIEKTIRSNKAHVERVRAWYDKHGGKEEVLAKYLIEVKDEEIISTLT